MVQYELTASDETLALQAQIAAMSPPDERPFAALNEFIGGKLLSNKLQTHIPLLSGRAKNFLEDRADLVALRRLPEGDYLSRFLQSHWIFGRHKKSDPFDCTTIHQNRHVVWLVAALDMVTAAVLLIGATVNLYLVSKPETKLGLIAMYTILFALSVTLCTHARPVEVFAATAAYAAVLVVFVSGDLGGASNNEQCLMQLKAAC